MVGIRPMQAHSWKLGIMVLVGCWTLLSAQSYAQNAVFSEAHTIAAPTTAVPVEHSFSITNAGTYTVTLTDLGALLTPAAPLASVKLAITSGGATVGSPLLAAGASQFTATAGGKYVHHVVGMPGNATAGSGPI